MKKILVLIFSLICCVAANAQSTTVSGQVTDFGGQTWNNGSITFTFVPNPAYPTGPYTWTGGTLPLNISGTLNGTGGYSISIPSNSAISPIGSTWSVQVYPQASSPGFSVRNLTISGASQTVNIIPPTILINLQTATQPVSAYVDGEITGTAPGSQYFNLTNATLRVCTTISGNSCTVWANVGSGAGAVTTTAGAVFGAFGYDFSASTLIPPNGWFQTNNGGGLTPNINQQGLSLVLDSSPAGMTPTNTSTNLVSFKASNLSSAVQGTGIPTFTETSALAGDIATKNASGVWVNKTPGVAGRVVTNSGTLAGADLVTCASGTGDRGATIIFTNASAVTETLPNPAAGACGSNFYGRLYWQGAAGGTLKATTATVNGIAGATGITGIPGNTWVDYISHDNINYDVYFARGIKCGTNLTEVLNADGTVSCNVAPAASTIPSGPGAGAVNVMTVTTAPAVTTNATGTIVLVQPNLANTTTTPTLNVGGAGAQTIVKMGSSGATIALQAGDYGTTAQNEYFTFVSNGTNWILLNPLLGQLGTQMYVDATGNLQCLTSASCSIGATNKLVAITANTVTAANQLTTGGGINTSGSATAMNLVQGADSSANGGTVTGGGNIHCPNESGTGSTTAGSCGIGAGGVTSATGLPGIFWTYKAPLAGGTATKWNIANYGSTANTASDSLASPATWDCVWVAVTNPTTCVDNGLVFINSSNATTVGDTFCGGLTAGKGTDSGGTSPCTLGATIGVVVDNSHTFNVPPPLGGTQAASSTLPLISINKAEGSPPYRISCTNVTPVTTSGGSVTTDQNMMACTIPANTLNVVNRTLRIYTAGTYSTAAASSAAMAMEAKICTVSGCGSGTVIDICDITSSALGAITVSNNTWALECTSTTQTAGASGVFERSGRLSIDLAVANVAADSIFLDPNATAVTSAVDTTAQLFLQISGAFSAASASNTFTERQLVVELIN
jgi:hypothetical protein